MTIGKAQSEARLVCLLSRLYGLTWLPNSRIPYTNRKP